ncbi:MAG TPA: glycosyltransferase family 4 protein [Gemmatimonadaceae bacterium]|nr:glycosyltransferase family 4 protein [Gemmatimonadaceae bacterium]
MSTSSPGRLRICLIAPGLYAWGSHNPTGRAARVIGRELARRGVRVSAVIPKRHGQRDLEQVDGIKVYGFRPEAPWSVTALARECDADVYHSFDPSMFTAMAGAAQRGRRHVVTIRAPHDWLREFRAGNRVDVATYCLLVENPIVWLAVHRADTVLCASDDLVSAVRTKYRVNDPVFLPTPVAIPRRVQKGKTPTVCFMGGWDRHRHPELFFDLARRFPAVTFIAVGRARDRHYDAHLRREYGSLANLEFTGMIDPFHSDALSNVLAESWILVNTGARRGVPDACVEAVAHRCAILSDADPDGFATRFGHHAPDGDLAAGLDALLTNDSWRSLGERGHEYVLDNYESEKVMERYLGVYEGREMAGNGRQETGTDS